MHCVETQDAFIDPLREEWLKLLMPVEWQWFVNLTFREETHPEAADKKYRRFINLLNRDLYGRRYLERGEGLTWVRGLEWQRREVVHFHALFADAENIDNKLGRFDQMRRWESLAGIARIYPIDDKQEAVIRYVTKYVVKGGEIDVSQNLAELVQQQALRLRR